MENKNDHEEIGKLKRHFINWVELKMGKPFTISHNLQMACLDEALELGYYKSLNLNESGSQNALSIELMMKGILASWVNNATLLLEQSHEEEVIYKGIEISEKEHQELRLQLLNEIRNMSLICSGTSSL